MLSFESLSSAFSTLATQSRAHTHEHTHDRRAHTHVRVCTHISTRIHQCNKHVAGTAPCPASHHFNGRKLPRMPPHPTISFPRLWFPRNATHGYLRAATSASSCAIRLRAGSPTPLVASPHGLGSPSSLTRFASWPVSACGDGHARVRAGAAAGGRFVDSFSSSRAPRAQKRAVKRRLARDGASATHRPRSGRALPARALHVARTQRQTCVRRSPPCTTPPALPALLTLHGSGESLGL